MANSGKQVKDALGRNAVIVNGVAVDQSANGQPSAVFNKHTALHGKYLMVKLGKKKHHLFVLAN